MLRAILLFVQIDGSLYTNNVCYIKLEKNSVNESVTKDKLYTYFCNY